MQHAASSLFTESIIQCLKDSLRHLRIATIFLLQHSALTATLEVNCEQYRHNDLILKHYFIQSFSLAVSHHQGTLKLDYGRILIYLL